MNLPPLLVSLIRNLPPLYKPVRVGRIISAICVKLGFSEWVEIQSEGVVFQLSLLCRTSAGEIWRGGNHGSEINMFSKAIEPATTFIDIGANVGLVAVPLGCKFRDCRGIAVEPIKRNVDALSRNLTLNSLTAMVAVIPVALAAVGAPIVMPPRVTVMAPAAMALLLTERTTTLEPMAPLLAIVLGPLTVGVTPDAKKPTGNLTVMVPPAGSIVAVVKLMVMDLPAAPGTRSAEAIVRAAPVTWPPSATDAAPSEA